MTHRTRIMTITAAAIASLLLAGCGGDDSSTTDDAPAAQVPEYTVTNEERGKIASADLVIPDATIESASAAIEDYASGIDGADTATITVVRDDSDAVYVCRGEWVASEEASQMYTGGRITADSWPALDLNCPDPKG
ncbi:hypothetical protein [Streptomyces xiamenensis]|uniref:hypothetical protein n=1 Tax=Streptomyces xiamenensis TaxID=408015 RepID=UPI0037D371BD